MKNFIVITFIISLTATGCSFWNRTIRRCGPAVTEIPLSPGTDPVSITFDTCNNLEKKAHVEALRYIEKYPQIVEALDELGRDGEFKALENQLTEVMAAGSDEDRARLVEELEIAILDLIAIARTNKKLFKDM